MPPHAVEDQFIEQMAFAGARLDEMTIESVAEPAAAQHEPADLPDIDQVVKIIGRPRRFSEFAVDHLQGHLGEGRGQDAYLDVDKGAAHDREAAAVEANPGAGHVRNPRPERPSIALHASFQIAKWLSCQLSSSCRCGSRMFSSPSRYLISIKAQFNLSEKVCL